MKRCLLFLITTLFILPSLYAGDEKPEIRWEKDEKRLILTLSGPTRGRLSLELGAPDERGGVNIIQVWVDDMMGIAMGEDHYGLPGETSENDMALGGSQDLLVLSGRQTDKSSQVSFTIPLDSGDEYDRILEEGEIPYTLICRGSDAPDSPVTQSISGRLNLR